MNLNGKQKGLLSKGVLEHLKDKNIRGCACVCTGRAGQNHCATGCHVLADFSPGLTTAHISWSSSKTWSRRGGQSKRAPFSFHRPRD